MLDRPVNPFIIGAPASTSKFIGRSEQVNTILSQLANPESRGSSAISGGPRIGKTSLLHYIASPEAAKEYGLSHSQSQFAFVFVDTQALGSYMDSQNVDTFSETVFWHYIILRLSSVCQIPGVEYSKKLLEQERVGALDLISLFAQVAAQDKLVVLLLDEFEWIINNIDPQRPTLLHTLRSLINRPVNERGLAVITSSEEPLSVLCRDIKFAGSPFPNSLVPIHLGLFSTQEARELIKGYLEGTGVSFTKDDVEFVARVSGCHPYFLQLACSYLFAVYREKKRISKVAREKARQAAEENLRVQAKPHFTYYWKHSSEDEKGVLITLAQRSQARGLRAWIANRRYGKLNERHALTSLANRGIVVKSDDGHHIFSPFFGMWIASQQIDTMLPEPAGAEDAEAVAELANIKANLDRNAQKYAKRSLWLYLGVLAAIWLGLVILTWHFGWNKMEPWTFFIGAFVTLGSYAYFAITQRELSPKAIYDQIVESKKRKIYQVSGFNLEKYERLMK